MRQQVKDEEPADQQPQDALLVLRIRACREPRAQPGEQARRRGRGLRAHALALAPGGSRHSFWICNTSFFMAPKACAMRGSKCRPASLATY